MMKKYNFMPFALSAIVLALSGCGGESGNFINENETNGVTASSSCSVASATCLGFVLDYPVAGLNFNCSSDTNNNFITAISGNAVTGACKLGDKVTFSIQGANTNNRINLGTLDLNSITKLKIDDSRITILDIATALTNQAPQTLDASDPTIKVAMALVKIFQAVGVQQAQNAVGDIQVISLTEPFKSNLSNATGSVGLAELSDGSYANIIRNWVDVSIIDDATAFKLVKQLALQNVSGVFQSDFLPLTLPGSSAGDISVEGFYGTGNGGRQLIANMYLLTDRSGFTYGYGLQWKGVPTRTTENQSDALLRINLLTQTVPQKMTANAQNTWLDPLNLRIANSAPFQFNVADASGSSDPSSILNINQGKLVNGVAILGTEPTYKSFAKTETAPAADLAKWSQSNNSVQEFTGSLDISKTGPITYLDRQVFKTINTVNSGERYIFPLYADLEFKFASLSPTITPVKLGIVIDENGDIRTNIRNGATADDMSSGNICSTVDANMMGSNGVQQYRIGTVVAANASENDKSLPLRMILADPVFGKLEGLVLGLNQTFRLTSDAQVSSSGVKLNIGNLLSSNGEGAPVSITGLTTANSVAEWANIYASYQLIYNAQADKNASLPRPTPEQQALQSRTRGSITSIVSLPTCYTAMLPTMIKPSL